MDYIHTIRVGEQEYAIASSIDDTSTAADKTWSAKKLIRQERSLLERLCPPISREGRAVRCQPVAGYPLQVTTLFSGDVPQTVTLTLCGKNLFDYTAYPFEDVMIYDESGAANNSTGFSAFKDFMPIGHLKGETITLNHPGVEKNANTHAALVFYDGEKKYISGSNGYSHVVPETAEYVRFSVPREYADGTGVQLELGSQVTQYEPYRKQEFTAQPNGDRLWEPVAAEGCCTLWSSAGKTRVEGRADPVALLQSLAVQ